MPRSFLTVAIAAAINSAPLVDGLAEQSPQLGPRPFFLVDQMKDSALKSKLASCMSGPFAFAAAALSF